MASTDETLEEELIELKKKLLNESIPSASLTTQRVPIAQYRKNRLATLLRVEKTLARLKDYCFKSSQ